MNARLRTVRLLLREDVRVLLDKLSEHRVKCIKLRLTVSIQRPRNQYQRTSY